MRVITADYHYMPGTKRWCGEAEFNDGREYCFDVYLDGTVRFVSTRKCAGGQNRPSRFESQRRAHAVRQHLGLGAIEWAV